MRRVQLIPECHAETEMVRVLFEETKENDYLNHASGIHAVSSILKKEDIIGYLNIGFVDNDKKNTPPYFDEFQLIEANQQVSLKKHPKTNDYLVVVNPAIERFILSQLNEIQKSPSDYDLPDDDKGFRKKLKNSRIGNHEGYQQMISELKNSKTSGISFILEKISELRNQ